MDRSAEVSDGRFGAMIYTGIFWSYSKSVLHSDNFCSEGKNGPFAFSLFVICRGIKLKIKQTRTTLVVRVC